MKRIFDTYSPYLEEVQRIIVTIFCVMAILIFIGHKSLSLFYKFPLDYGEAPLVDQAMRLISGQNIYRNDLSIPPYTISNYPPVYPLALAPFVALFGPELWPGRLLSTLSALATAFFLSQIVQSKTRDRTAGRVAGVLFLAIPYVVGWSSLARVDLLALALSTGGLAMLVRHANTRRGLVVGALLLVAAIYTRQSYGLAAPLAACVWTWRRHGWRRAVVLAGIVASVSLALLLVLNLTTQGGFFFNIVTANVNPFHLEKLLDFWRGLRETLPILLGLGTLGIGVTAWGFLTTPTRESAPPDSIWPLAGTYLFAAAIAALTVGKIGSNINYLLELSAALSLVAGILMAAHAVPFAENSPKAEFAIRNAIAILLVIQLGFMMRNTLQGTVQDLKARRQPEVRLKDLLWEVRRTNGPILADEFMGLLTLNNKSLYIQPFEMTQLANAGLWDQTPLLESIRTQEFPMILIHHFMGYPVYTERWTPEMLNTIFTYYTADGWAGESIIFRPRNTNIHPPAGIVACPGAPWQLPSRADMGVWWLTQGLIFMGEGFEGTVPVVAVADGLLLRHSGWRDAVAILHDDPIKPAEKVWTYYAGMAPAWGNGSYVVPEFPLGSENIPVKKGQLLGYQGTSHEGTMAIWPHGFFGVAEPLHANGGFPYHVLSEESATDPLDRNTFLDPSPYLGTAIYSPVMGTPVWLPLRCLGMAR